MSTHYSTAPRDRIPMLQRLIYGLGAFVNNLLAAAIGGMMIVLNLGLGINPAVVGWLAALPRLTDAFTDPLMGYITDNTRTRWGRRRPYIFAGAILAGLFFALLWQLPRGQSDLFYFWFFFIGSIIFYLAYTMFATPWTALGYELTPDYHERTRLMGTQFFIGNIAYIVAPWFLLFMQNETFFDDMVDGAAGLAIVIGITTAVVGILPAIFLRERFQDSGAAAASGTSLAQNLREFFAGFVAALKFRPFQKLCVAAFLVFNGFILISAFQSYVIIYYVFAGDKVLGAQYVGYAGSLGTVSTLLVIPLITWMSTKIGKRRAFFLGVGVSMLGYGLKWFCYNPEVPWLLLIPAPLQAFGLGTLFTLTPSMIADVVDLDELQTHERREGMYGSIFWWVIKLGLAAALALGGMLLHATGFDVALDGNQTDRAIFLMRLSDAFVPFAASGVAVWAIASYSLTEERAHEVREALEQRRGAPGGAQAVPA